MEIIPVLYFLFLYLLLLPYTYWYVFWSWLLCQKAVTKVGILLLSLILSFHFLLVECDVSMSLSYISPLVSLFPVYSEVLLVMAVACWQMLCMCVCAFHFNLINRIYWFPYVDPLLHPMDNPHLIIADQMLIN